MPQARVRRRPRRAARARFSSMVMVGAVPSIGSWNTRPIMAARLCSLWRVMSTPSMLMLPPSISKAPAMALSMVLLPAPLPPMTVTKSPSFKRRLRPLSAVLAFIVPGLKVLETFLSSSIVLFLLEIDGALARGCGFALPVGDGEKERYYECGE